jgi:hypothetical protein
MRVFRVGARRRPARVPLIPGMVLVTLTGCLPGGSSSGVTAAEGAGTPACAKALAAAPATVAELARTPVSVAGALSWGEPPVVLRCGLPAQPPTTKRCLGIDAIDWVVDEESDPIVFVSYGRDPAVELRVPASYGRENAVAAAVDVAPVVTVLPSNGRSCVGSGDVASAGVSASP